jgi:hypothetical protein
MWLRPTWLALRQSDQAGWLVATWATFVAIVVLFWCERRSTLFQRAVRLCLQRRCPVEERLLRLRAV